MTNVHTRLAALGITEADCEQCGLPEQVEATELVDAGLDIFNRPQKMTARTLEHWQTMKSQAEEDGVILELVSAYRSVEYQCGLIQRKLDRGTSIEDILKVNAIPGYSEHHTGRALDLTTPGCEPLEECFEATAAFRWLLENADKYGFTLSYPRDHPSAIQYEPWHWCYQED